MCLSLAVLVFSFLIPDLVSIFNFMEMKNSLTEFLCKPQPPPYGAFEVIKTFHQVFQK